MNLWSRFRKRRAISQYARILPRALLRDYGASGTYTPQQIRRTIERSGLNIDYSCYALSMFADRGGFDDFHTTIGETCDFDAMRGEVAASHFHGNQHFTFQDALSYSAESAAGAEHSVSHGTDGHHGHH